MSSISSISGMPSTPGKRQESLVGQTLCNDEYYIQRVIGHGGMGKVYLASHSELAVPLAIKQTRADAALPESVTVELDYVLQGGDLSKRPAGLASLEFPNSGGEHTDRFLREALFLARLRHPALPMLYDYFSEGGSWYLVMDYIPGPTLTDYLRQQGALPPLEALNYAMQLCDVFDYLHRQSPPIIFRDLKPSNIILTPHGTLLMVDFGIARYFKPGQGNDTTDFGSPGYASPEQYQTEGQTDARSDLFSLGVLLHEMVSGERPKAPGAITGVMGAMRDTARQINPNVSSALSGLVTLATRTEPMYRFQSAHTFYLALERAYLLEEHRTYQQRVLLEQAMQTDSVPEHIEDAETIPLDTDDDEQEGQFNVSDVATNGMLSPIATSRQGEQVQGYSLDNAQRRVIRETLQQMRRERLEEEELELQLASVDEALVQRFSMPLSQVHYEKSSRPVLVDEDEFELKPVQNARRGQGKQGGQGRQGAKSVQNARREPRKRLVSSHSFSFPYSPGVSRFIRASFVVVLIVFLVLLSLLAYQRVVHHTSSITQGQRIQATIPAQMSTATQGIVSNTTGTWQQLPSFDSPEADNTAIYVRVQGRDYIYVNGGYRGATQSPHYDHHFYRYDIAAAHWETLSGAQFPGMVNNAVAVDASGNMFYTVGYSSDSYGVTSLLYKYQPTSATLQKIMPSSNVQLGYGDSMLADSSGHLYITQGFLKSGNAQATTGWYRYDITSGQWHTLAPLPAGLGYVILAPDTDGSILLIGGAFDSGQQHQSQAIYRYNPVTDAWSQAATNTPISLSGASSALVQPGKLVIIGGYDVIHRRGQAQAWLVDLHTLRWTPLTSLPIGGSVMGAAASDGNGHVYLVRGASDPSRPTSDFWQLTL